MMKIRRTRGRKRTDKDEEDQLKFPTENRPNSHVLKRVGEMS